MLFSLLLFLVFPQSALCFFFDTMSSLFLKSRLENGCLLSFRNLNLLGYHSIMGSLFGQSQVIIKLELSNGFDFLAELISFHLAMCLLLISCNCNFISSLLQVFLNIRDAYQSICSCLLCVLDFRVRMLLFSF
jgi:hypothetical protein